LGELGLITHTFERYHAPQLAAIRQYTNWTALDSFIDGFTRGVLPRRVPASIIPENRRQGSG
jgi:hypothetical protein